MVGIATALQAVGIAGEIASGIGAQNQASKDRKWQQRLAKNQVQFRVADAKAAGVHPLYALGMQPGGYSPPMHYQGDYGAGSLREMGQDISRATLARETATERRAEMARAAAIAARSQAQEDVLFKQQVRRNELEMQYLGSQIARAQSNQVGPPEPSPRSRTIPSEVIAPASDLEPGRQAGQITDYQYARSVDGGVRIVPSADIAQRFDEIPGAGIGWAFRNNIVPALTGRRPPYPTDIPLPRGRRWEWDRATQSWRDVPMHGTYRYRTIRGRRGPPARM